MPINVFDSALQAFVEKVRCGEIEVYNEFSLQHEFGTLLRERYRPLRVQFERNTKFFFPNVANFVKHEIDISIFDPSNQRPHIAIELKFPRNGQVPEQMFAFCKDLAFLEGLVHAGFAFGALIVIADDKDFYTGNTGGIYGFFRGAAELFGTITKPTGKRDETVTLTGRYRPHWQPIAGSLMYSVLRVGGS
jgi:hypothetical protein